MSINIWGDRKGFIELEKTLWFLVAFGSTSKVIFVDLTIVVSFVFTPNVIPSKDHLGIYTVGDTPMWVSVVQYFPLVVGIGWAI
jgi:hypothetical protein